MRRLEKLDCPLCGREMKEGYVFSPRQILWTENEKNKVIENQSEMLVGVPMWKSKKVAAYRCEECGIVTFEYKPIS